jgi:hypothetical protein
MPSLQVRECVYARWCIVGQVRLLALRFVCALCGLLPVSLSPMVATAQQADVVLAVGDITTHLLNETGCKPLRTDGVG